MIDKARSSSIIILDSFNYHINNIIEIIKQPALYQYEGYYAFSHPEIINKNIESYWYRPCRLVDNEFRALKKEQNHHLGFILT